MTSLIKNQILKHLTRFFKDLAPEHLQLSAFKGSCELSNLQLEEKVLMDLLSFPAWIQINKAGCDQLTIRIPWTKIKSVPIQMNLNEVTVEVEVCEEFRDISSNDTDEANISNVINAQAPGKYGFVDRVIDGITVTVNNVLIIFKSKIMTATFNLSRVLLESRCPNWKPGELSLTRIKDTNRGQILLFKIVEWQTMRLEAKCLTDPNQAPLRLITNHAQCRLTIKKNLDDCSVVAARIFVIFEDILWVLTFAQFISAASFVEYVFTLIKRSPMSKKSGMNFEDSTSAPSPLANFSGSAPSFVVPPTVPGISPMNTPIHNQQDRIPILSGNLSSASLLEQKFLCYDLVETSLHLFIDKVDAHLYDDIEISPSSNSRDSGGALQTTFDQIQVDCYPYSRVVCDRKHWYKWFDPSPLSRKHWFNSHFAEFDLIQMQNFQNIKKENLQRDDANQKGDKQNVDKSHSPRIPIAADDQLLSLTVLVKIKDYCMNCVATRNLVRGAGLNKFIETDKDYQMPSEMPSFYLELNYFYYFDIANRMMVYDNVPDPLAYIHLSPTKLLFDSPTLVFLNSFQVNLSKALAHLNDLFPDETTAPKVHCRIEILMPQISLPAKQNNDQLTNKAPSTLLVKSGKITLSSSIHDKDLLAKLMDSIEKLRENPSQPINIGGYQNGANKKDNSCTGDWTKVWNASLINGMSEFNIQNQLWAIQFEPVWMDFMNYDVDQVSSGQRLEPIVEPVTAYAFIHLSLMSSFAKTSDSDNKLESKKNRDVISILVSVLNGAILANMDKIQFSFLQRLGMQVEKLIQQIKADASTTIQLDTIVEDTLEINLTAYIKEIKARLILDKKIESSLAPVADSSIVQPIDKSPLLNQFVGKSSETSILPASTLRTKSYSDSISSTIEAKGKNPFEGIIYSQLDSGSVALGSNESLDECVEVADDASCVFLNDNSSIKNSTTLDARSLNSLNPNKAESDASLLSSSLITPKPETSAIGKSSIEESLLINLDEMEQSSALFAKVNLAGKTSPLNLFDQSGVGQVSSRQPVQEQQRQQQQQLQEIETESISYLELSMSQLMVRRITETKRRQKF